MKKVLLTFFMGIIMFGVASAAIITKPADIISLLPAKLGEWSSGQDQTITPNENEMYIVRTYTNGTSDVFILGVTISPVSNNQATTETSNISSMFNIDSFKSICGGGDPVTKNLTINNFSAISNTFTCDVKSFNTKIVQNGVEINLFNEAQQKESGYKYTVSLYSIGVGANMQALSIDEMMNFANQLDLLSLENIIKIN